LNSIFSQNIDSSLYEVIVVNDGTLDNSMQIVDKFVLKYNNLFVINQENQGLSMARNNGKKIAKGKYIWFVDSDDWIEQNSIQEIFSIIEKNDVDVISMLANRIEEISGKIKKDAFSRFLAGKLICSGKEYLFDEGHESPSQLFVFKRKFLEDNNLNFMYGIKHEDNEFGIRCLYLANKVYMFNNHTYNYLLRNSGSIMSSFGVGNVKSIIKIIESLIRFESCIDEKEIVRYRSLVAGTIVGFSQLIKKSRFPLEKSEYHELSEVLKKYIDKYILYHIKSKHFAIRRIKEYLVVKIYFFRLYN